MNRRIEGTWARWPAWLTIAILIAVYIFLTGTLSARRPLWNDELFTYYIAARPSFGNVWDFLLTGAEQLPPLFYVITRTGLGMFGVSELSLRLFEMLGVAVAALSVYCFTVRRVSSTSAAAGAVFLLCTSAYQYAYEARPYGLVLAFFGLGLVAWQRAADLEGGPRLAALAGLALMLSAAIHMHYYAVLLLGSLWAAELVRNLIRRRLDLPVWVSLTFPLATFLVVTPLLRASAAYAGTFWARPSWYGAFDTYNSLLYPAVPAIILVTVAICLSQPAALPMRSKRPRPPIHEAVAMAGLVLLPFEGIVLAKTVTGAFTPRYVLAAVLGIAVLVAWALDWAVGDRPGVSTTTTVLMGACFLVTFVHDQRGVQAEADNVRDVCRFLADTDPDLPLAIANPHLFFQLSHYAPRQVATRLAYLADAKIALDRTQTDTVERGLINLRQIAPLNVIDYRRFLASRPVFLLYSSPGAFSWLVSQLADDGLKIQVAHARGDALLLRVTGTGSVRR